MKSLLSCLLISISLFSNAQQIAAGGTHSLILCADGQVLSFGQGGWGQLGTGLSDNQYSPVIVQNLPAVVQLSCGERHSFALTADGDVYAWGANEHGQIGTGEANPYYLEPVLLETINNVIQIEGGRYMTIALKADGTVWAWGRNDSGSLGNGTYDNSSIPVQVSGLEDVVQIGVGDWHAFALTENGEVYGWGQNNFAVLGLGSDFPPTYNTPQAVNIQNVSKLKAGYNHSLALKEDGTVWVWGDDSFGQLGQGDPAFANAPIIVPGLTEIIDISCGISHNLALDENGDIFTWGYNDYGQLGIGSTNDSNTPTSLDFSSINKISAGDYHCLAVNSEGQLISFGRNDGGQLGIGNQTDAEVPAVSEISCESPDNIAELPALEFTLYPNPVNSDLNLSAKFDDFSLCNICIFSSDGKLIFQENGPFENFKTINTLNLESGIYCLQLKINNNISSGYFIKE